MTHNKQQKEVTAKSRRDSLRNERRLSTLKLWQMHIQSLSKPENKPLVNRYHEEYEFTEMHTISESTIVSSDSHKTRVTFIEEDDYAFAFELQTGCET